MEEIYFTVEKEGRGLRVIRGCVIKGYDLNNYEVVNGFTPKELYEMDCPKEIFLYILDMYGADFKDELYTNPVSLEYYPNDNPIIKYFPWFLEKGFIRKKTKDIELTPGMKLQDKTNKLFGEDIFQVFEVAARDLRVLNTSDGHRWHEVNYYGKTLKDLNHNGRFKFEVIE